MKGNVTPGSAWHAGALIPVVIICVIAAVGISIMLVRDGFLAISADESERILSARGLTFRSAFDATTWLPLHRILIGTAMRISGEMAIAPRVVSVVFGVLAILSLTAFACRFFGRVAGAVTAVLATFHPDRVVLSTVPLSDIIFITCLLFALQKWAAWLENKKVKDLYWFAAALATAAGVRYEGWVIAGLASALIIDAAVSAKRLSPRHAAAVTGILALVPLLWMSLHWFQHGTPFGFLGNSADRYAFVHGDDFMRTLRRGVGGQFVKATILDWMIVGVIGAVGSVVKSRDVLRWAVLPLGSFISLSLLALFGLALPSHGFWRLAAPWNLLLLPFAAMMLVLPISLATNRHASRRRVAMFISAFLVIVFTTNLGQNAWSRTRDSHFTQHDRAAGEFISALLTESDGDVGVENTRWHFIHIRVASRHPDRVHPLAGGDPLRPERTLNDALQKESLCARRIKYVLLRGNRAPEIGPIIREFGPWVLYRNSCGETDD